MFTNPNLVIATISVGVISVSAVFIIVSILSQRESSKWHDKEEELFVSVKDSVNAHTDHKIAELENRLKDNWSDSVSSIIPIVSSGVNENLTNVKQLLVRVLTEQENLRTDILKKVDLTNKSLSIHLKDSNDFSKELIGFLDNEFKMIDNTLYKNLLYIVKHFKAEVDMQEYNKPDEIETTAEPQVKKCLYCGKKIPNTKQNAKRKFCKEKDGISNYCRNTHYKIISKGTNV
jgi:hypothetical protein